MRLIDADALIPMMKYATTDSEIGVFPIKIGFNAITEVINNASTIDAEPVRHGKWIETEENHGFDNEVRNKALSCSVCHVAFRISDYALIEDFRYCPNCGTKMEADHDSD